MANNPSSGRYISERTIYETLVGGQSHLVPRYEEAVKEPKPAMYNSYAIPVERNPFVNIDMLIVPPIDAQQEALNQWGREGYLRQALAVDKRIQEQQILQQSTESKVNAIVNDEYERRRAVKRGVYEAVGMTPAEIDERFAGEVLAGQEGAIQRATTDGQVRDALVRYFTLRGGVVPAFLQPPRVVADGTNTELGDGASSGIATGLAEADFEDYQGEVDEGAEAEDRAELGGAGEGAPLPPAGRYELTPSENSQMDLVLVTRPPPAKPSGYPTKEALIKWLRVNVGDIIGNAGRPVADSTAKTLDWGFLARQCYDANQGIAGAVERDLGKGGAGGGGRPPASGYEPIAPDTSAGGGAGAGEDTDPAEERRRRKLRPPPTEGGAGAPARAGEVDWSSILGTGGAGGGFGAGGGGGGLPNPSLRK